VRLHSRSGETHYYHVGRFMDRMGTSHWLVVREARLKVWRNGQMEADEAVGETFFYEVITDADLIGRVKEKISLKPAGQGQTAEEVGII